MFSAGKNKFLEYLVVNCVVVVVGSVVVVVSSVVVIVGSFAVVVGSVVVVVGSAAGEAIICGMFFLETDAYAVFQSKY